MSALSLSEAKHGYMEQTLKGGTPSYQSTVLIHVEPTDIPMIQAIVKARYPHRSPTGSVTDFENFYATNAEDVLMILEEAIMASEYVESLPEVVTNHQPPLFDDDDWDWEYAEDSIRVT